MDWKQQFKVHDLSCRETFIVLLVIAVCEVILMFLFPWQPDRETVCRAVCGGKQRSIYRIMSEVSGEEGFELPPEWTVADLIREAAGKDFKTCQPRPGESFAEKGHRLEKEYLCRSVHYERKFPYLRRERKEVVRQYLVFPVPASAVLDGSLPQPVPILMCPPGAHGDERTPVLYSDGSENNLTKEEAEKLAAEQSPVPLEIVFETGPGEDRESQ